jgi:hypothetical protein
MDHAHLLGSASASLTRRARLAHAGFSSRGDGWANRDIEVDAFGSAIQRVIHNGTQMRGANPQGCAPRNAQPPCRTVPGMPTFEVTLRDRSVETVDGADAYQQEGPMTTFFRRGDGRGVIDSWSTRVASFRTADLLAVRRCEAAVGQLRAVTGSG